MEKSMSSSSSPTASLFRFSARSLVAGGLIHLVVVFGLTFLFCWGTGTYTLRKAADALQAIGFCYMLLGLTIWGGRVLRFYNETAHFTALFKETKNDRPELPPARRGLLLGIFENQILIPWVAVGLAAVVVSLLFGYTLSAQFPPNSVLNFLVRSDLPPQLMPGGFFGK